MGPYACRPLGNCPACPCVKTALYISFIVGDGSRTGMDPGFQVRKIEKFWGISCEKITILCKKIIFFPILEGGRTPGAPPPWICPCRISEENHAQMYNIGPVIFNMAQDFFTKDLK